MSGHFLNRRAACHKNEPHFAKGLCKRCYAIKWSSERRRTREIGICKKCKRSIAIASKGLCHTCYLILRKEKIKREFLEEQENLCAIDGCNTDTSAYKLSDWQLDHDHLCGGVNLWCGDCVRGVLCRPCNHALGCVDDSIENLQGLIGYLRENGV